MTMANVERKPNSDIVIVGGGSAGTLLAARLSEEPDSRVLLIEAGEEATDPDIWKPAAWPTLQGRSYDWDYRTEPQAGTAGRVHHWARGRLIGGSSCLHAMGYMRGHPSDFQAWVDATGDRRWSWDELLSVFQAIEDHPLGGDGIHGKGGPLPIHLPADEVSPLARAFIEAGAALGLPRLEGHNSGEMIGVTPNSLNIRDGRRVTAADALAHKGRSRPQKPNHPYGIPGAAAQPGGQSGPQPRGRRATGSGRSLCGSSCTLCRRAGKSGFADAFGHRSARCARRRRRWLLDRYA